MGSQRPRRVFLTGFLGHGKSLLALLEKFGGDHLEETRRNHRAYLKTIGPRGGGGASSTEGEGADV